MIAITGSEGFIGRYITDVLPIFQKRLVRVPPSKERTGFHCAYFVEDFRNTERLDAFLSQAQTLIHLAWSGSPRSSQLDIEQDIEKNLKPTLRLFQRYAELNPSGHILFASSGGNIYGKLPLNDQFSETDIPEPLSNYSLLKLSVENYLSTLCPAVGVSATSMRISNPYGTLLTKNRSQGLIGIAFSKILAGESLQIIDPLDSVRDYLHLSDLADAISTLIAQPPGHAEHRVYNIASSKGHSIKEVIECIEKASKRHLDIKIEKGNRDDSSPDVSVLSIQKIKTELGWEPKIPFQEGIQAMWDRIVNSGIQ